jgi:hypothetical protein
MALTAAGIGESAVNVPFVFPVFPDGTAIGVVINGCSEAVAAISMGDKASLDDDVDDDEGDGAAAAAAAVVDDVDCCCGPLVSLVAPESVYSDAADFESETVDFRQGSESESVNNVRQSSSTSVSAAFTSNACNSVSTVRGTMSWEVGPSVMLLLSLLSLLLVSP